MRWRRRLSGRIAVVIITALLAGRKRGMRWNATECDECRIPRQAGPNHNFVPAHE